MKKAATLVAAALVASTTLAGCGGDSEYCAAVKDKVSVLDTFGTKKTDAQFKKYRRAVSEISKLAPEPVDKDWAALTKSLIEVRDAQKDAGLKLEDVTVKSVAGLSTAQSTGLNEAYKSFSDAVADHGQKITENVKSECGVKLK